MNSQVYNVILWSVSSDTTKTYLRCPRLPHRLLYAVRTRYDLLGSIDLLSSGRAIRGWSGVK